MPNNAKKEYFCKSTVFFCIGALKLTGGVWILKNSKSIIKIDSEKIILVTDILYDWLYNKYYAKSLVQQYKDAFSKLQQKNITTKNKF